MQVTRGVMYTRQEAEGKRLKHPFDTITEGIGINRQTRNFSQARIDGAFQGTDREAVEMASMHGAYEQYISMLQAAKLMLRASNAAACTCSSKSAPRLSIIMQRGTKANHSKSDPFCCRQLQKLASDS